VIWALFLVQIETSPPWQAEMMTLPFLETQTEVTGPLCLKGISASGLTDKIPSTPFTMMVSSWDKTLQSVAIDNRFMVSRQSMIEGHIDLISNAKLCGNGYRVSCGYDKRLCLWSANLQSKGSYQHSSYVTDVVGVTSLKGFLLYFTDSEGYLNSLEISAKSSKLVERICVSQKQATRVEMSSDHRFLFVGDQQNMIKIFERQPSHYVLRQVGAFPIQAGCTVLSVSDDCFAAGDDLGNLYCMQWHQAV